jgi:probable F420-dependent oxidoreductase
MKHGLFMFPTHDAIDPGSLAALAEDAGFESLFFPDHTHIPANRLSPFPGGGELGREYFHNLDVFVAMAAAAAATSRLLVASGICLLTQRDPIVCAKTIASLDQLSGGRIIFGVGAGWNREEMENHGTDPRTRFELLRERTEAVRAIWTQDEASYHGRFVDFDAIWSWPKPAQAPHPPILLAGNGAGAVERVIAFADGWCPLPEPGLPERIAELRARASAAGREVSVSVLGLSPDRDVLGPYEEAGAERAVFAIRPGRRDDVERQLDEVMAVVG